MSPIICGNMRYASDALSWLNGLGMGAQHLRPLKEQSSPHELDEHFAAETGTNSASQMLMCVLHFIESTAATRVVEQTRRTKVAGLLLCWNWQACGFCVPASSLCVGHQQSAIKGVGKVPATDRQ